MINDDSPGYRYWRRCPDCGTIYRYAPPAICVNCGTVTIQELPLMHGTYQGYKRGCRCHFCVAACTQFRRELRARKRLEQAA